MLVLKNLESKKFKKSMNLKNLFSLKLKFGNLGFFCLKQFIFDFIYLSFFKKKFKKTYFLKKKFKQNKKMWIFLKKNYIVSLKSKNSSMGKGKGLFIRNTVFLKKFFIFFEFFNFNFFFMNKFLFLFKLKYSLPFYLIFENYNYFFDLNYNNFFINKLFFQFKLKLFN